MPVLAWSIPRGRPPVRWGLRNLTPLSLPGPASHARARVSAFGTGDAGPDPAVLLHIRRLGLAVPKATCRRQVHMPPGRAAFIIPFCCIRLIYEWVAT